MRTTHPWFFGFLAIAACDAGDEPLATIEGTVVDERSTSVEEELEIGLVWQGKRDGGWGVSGDVTAVSTSFPSDYVLEINAPPPPEARSVGAEYWLNLCDDPQWCVQYPEEVEAELRDQFDAISVASLFVAKKGAFDALGEAYGSPSDEQDAAADEDPAQRISAFWESIVGGAEGSIIYVDRDFSADSYIGMAVGEAVSAGYYFMPWSVPTEAMWAAADACIDEAGGDALAELECNLVAFADSRTLENLDGIQLRMVDDPAELFPSGEQ